MKTLLLLLLPYILLSNTIEGIWKFDALQTQEKNPNTQSYRPFAGATLEFKEGQIFQNSVAIAYYKIQDEKILESLDKKAWKLSALNLEKEILTLQIDKAILYFKAFKIKKEKAYSLNHDAIAFSEDNFYTKDGQRAHNEEGKIPWKFGDFFTTFTALKSISYRIYSTKKNKPYQSDTYIYQFKDNTAKSFSYRLYGLGQADWIDINWHRIDTNNKEINSLSFSPLFGRITLFHFVSKEEIITPVGTFLCSKFQAILEPWDEKIIVWTINDKPGIYAKLFKLKSKKLYLLDSIKEN